MDSVSDMGDGDEYQTNDLSGLHDRGDAPFSPVLPRTSFVDSLTDEGDTSTDSAANRSLSELFRVTCLVEAEKDASLLGESEAMDKFVVGVFAKAQELFEMGEKTEKGSGKRKTNFTSMRVAGKPCGELVFKVSTDNWERLEGTSVVVESQLCAAKLIIPMLFKHMGLEKNFGARNESPHRTLIDPVFALAIALVDAANVGEIEITNEDNINCGLIHGPLDYSVKRKVEGKMCTMFVMEAKQYDTFKDAFPQVVVQMVCLKKLSCATKPVCGVVSDGLRYQFVVLGSTMFFTSEVLWLEELPIPKDGLTLASVDQVARTMAALLIGRVPLEMKEQWTPMFVAALKGEKIDDWTDRRLVEPLRKMQPLHVAARLGNQHLCEDLLKRGHPLFEKDSQGYTPLRWAAWKNSLEAFEVLLLKQLERDPDAAKLFHEADDGTTIFDVFNRQFQRVFVKVVQEHNPEFFDLTQNEKLRGLASLWMKQRAWEKLLLWEGRLHLFGISLPPDGVVEVTNLEVALSKGYLLMEHELLTFRSDYKLVRANVAHVDFIDNAVSTLCMQRNWRQLAKIASLVMHKDIGNRVGDRTLLWIGYTMCLGLNTSRQTLAKELKGKTQKSFDKERQKARNVLAESLAMRKSK